MKFFALATLLAACTLDLPQHDERAVGIWADANHRPIELSLYQNGTAIYRTDLGTTVGTWESINDDVIAYSWPKQTSACRYQVTDGGDTLVTIAFDEILTLYRVGN